MSCDKISQEINLYLDNEVSADEKQSIEEHLKGCPACQNLFAQERRVEQKLVAIISQPMSDDEAIWNRSIASFGVRNRQFVFHRILKYLVPATAAALVFLAVFFIVLPDSASDLLAEVEQKHQAALKPEFQPDFQTDSPKELVKYFGEEYDLNIFGCKCSMAKEGFCFKGCGTCPLRGRQAGHIVLCYQNTPISIFALLEKDLSVFPGAQSHLTERNEIYQTKFKGFNCAIVRLNKNIICAMGSVSEGILKQLLIDAATGKPIKQCNCDNSQD